MKKVLSFIMLVFSLFLLTSCDLFTKDKKEELEMTKEQMQAVVDEIDFSSIISNIIVLKTDVDINVELVIDSEDFDEPVDLGIEVKGKLDVYANLESFENSYIYVDADLKYELDGEYELFVPYDEWNEQYDPNYAAEYQAGKAMFDSFKKASIAGKIYVVKGVLYLNVKIAYAGTTIEMKEYYELFDEEDFDDFKEMFEEKFLDDIGEIDLSYIPDEISIKPYKVGNSYEFEFKLADDLEKVLEMLLDELSDDDYIDFDIQIKKNEKFDNYVKVQFADKLEKIEIHSDTDFEFVIGVKESGEEAGGIEASIFIKVNLELDINGKMPKNLPKEGDFKDYVKGTGGMFN